MSTTIRLKKVGRKGQHTFRIVVTDKAKSRDGKPLEELGSYNPHTNEINIDMVRADFWKEKGALPSLRAKKLLKWAVEGVPVKPKKTKKDAPKTEETTPASEAAADEQSQADASADAEASQEETAETPVDAEEPKEA